MLKGTNKKLNIEEKVHYDLFLKINSIETTMKSLMNRNIVSYSNRSKTTEILSNDVLHLSINSVTKSFVFTYANNSISISMLENAISNLKYINDISVDDLITAKNIMNNQYLIDSFSSINNVLDLYKKHILIDEDNDTITIVNDIIVNKIDAKSLFINGVDYYKEFTDLNNYVDKFVEETDVKFTSIDNEITTINNNYDSFKTEFNNHTHTDLTLNTLNGMPIIGNNSEFITTYPFIPTVGWYPFNIMQNLDFHNKTKSGYIWRLCAYNDTDFQIINNGTNRLTIDKYGVYINKDLRCDTINGINTSNISLNTHTHSYNDLTNIPETFPPAEHNHDDKYASIEHVHNYEDLVDIPETFPPAEHNHDDKYATINHTHTTLNELTIEGIKSNKVLCLTSTRNSTYIKISDADKTDTNSGFIALDYLDGKKFLALWCNDGLSSYEALRIHPDKITTNLPLTCESINGINTSDISLNTHDHDTVYAKLDHNHDNRYVQTNYGHFYGDSVWFEPKQGGTSYFTSLWFGYWKDHTMGYIDYDGDKGYIRIHLKASNKGLYIYEKSMEFYGDFKLTGLATIAQTLAFDSSLKLVADDQNSLSIKKEDDSKLFGFGEDKNRPGTTATDTYLEFKRSDSTTSYEWRIYSLSNHNLDFINYQGKRAGYINCISNNQMNTTITHNAPLTEDLDKYKIGAPVFMSGKVYKLIDGKYVDRTDTTDCIPSVKAEGKYKEYLGIIVAKHKAGETVTVGDVVKQDVIIDQDTIDFATHGDFYLEVNDASSYKVGDTILYNGDIVNDEEPMTNKIQRMIAGVITAIVGASTLAIFKT